MELIQDSIRVNTSIEIEEYARSTYPVEDGIFHEAVLVIDKKEAWHIQANLMKWKLTKLKIIYPSLKKDALGIPISLDTAPFER